MQLVSLSRLRIVTVLLVLVGAALLGGSYRPLSAASAAVESGRLFTVDISRPASADQDGNYQYRTLVALFAPGAYPKPSEHDLVLVAPGVYAGALLISTKGLTLRATAGPELTVIQGEVSFAAPDLTLEGFTVEAAGAPAALRLTNAPGATLLHDRLSGAGSAGLQLSRSPFLLARDSQISHNAGSGILIAQDSFAARLSGLQVQGNGGAGIVIEQSDRVQLASSTVSLNGSAGIRIENAQGAQISRSKIGSNAGAGIELIAGGNSRLVTNELSDNAAFGISLNNSSDNLISKNYLHDNDQAHVASGGIGIEGSATRGSHDNRLSENRIEGHTQQGAAGILLRGRVSGSQISENRIEHNYRGIVLRADAGGRPRANRLIANRIGAAKAEGIFIGNSGGANIIIKNIIQNNLGIGVHLSGGGRDRFQDDLIEHNGREGFLLENSPDNSLVGERVMGNGQAGLRLESGSDRTWIADSQISGNNDAGLILSGVRSVRVQSSSLRANGGAGIGAQDAGQLRLYDSLLQGNGEVGLQLEGVVQSDLTGNRFRGNRQGGVLIGGSSRVIDLSENSFASNGFFGLKVEPGVAGLRAQRNWWAAAQGPSGVSPGGPAAAQLASGLRLAQVFPWLPAPPPEVAARSVRGEIYDQARGGETLDARDVAGARLRLLPGAQGGRALLLLASPTPVGRQHITPLRDALAFAYVQLAGLSSGSAEVSLSYDSAKLPGRSSPAQLQLFRWVAPGWQGLKSRVDLQSNQVSARLPVGELRQGLIALAPAKSPATPAQPPPTSPKQAAKPQAPQSPPQKVRPAPTPAPTLPQAGQVLLPAGEYAQDFRLDRPGATLGSADPDHPAIIYGHILIVAPGVTVQDLQIRPRGGVGVEIRATGAQLLRSDIQGAQIGIWVRGAAHVHLQDNLIEANGLGVSLEKADGAWIWHNRIVHNRAGGLRVEASSEVTAARNDLADDGPFNLQVRQAPELFAQLNWWGSPQGPGDSAQGVSLSQIFPWLTEPFARDQRLAVLRFRPSSVREKLARFISALLRLDLPRSWQVLSDWLSGSETLSWAALPGLRLRLAGLRAPGWALLAQISAPPSNPPATDLVLLGLRPRRIRLSTLAWSCGAPQLFRFNASLGRWLPRPGGWMISPGAAQSKMSAWRWVPGP